MNKDEIKKGLTVCAGDTCDNCSYYKFHNCYDRLKLDARSLIIEQEKKIEKLKDENKQLKTECALLDDELRIARQDTIDVLNKVKEKLNNTPNGWAYTTYIDELIKGGMNDEVNIIEYKT